MYKKLSLASLALIGLAGQAESAVLNLDYETTSPDGVSVVTAIAPGYDGINVLSAPGSYTYSNSIAHNTGTIPGNSSVTDGFYDDYVFSIAGNASGSSMTATIALGSSFVISDLQARLIKRDDGTYQTLTGTINPPDSVLNAWTNAIGTAGSTASFSNQSLAAGTYILQIRGLASGTYGGVYTGSLELAPVPLPAAAWLLLSALTGLTTIVRHRK